MNSSRTFFKEPVELPKPKPDSQQGAVNQSQGKPDLPPFDVLVNWLSYYHSETGVWPEPDKNTNPVPACPKVEDKSRLTILPDRKKLLPRLAADQKLVRLIPLFLTFGPPYITKLL